MSKKTTKPAVMKKRKIELPDEESKAKARPLIEQWSRAWQRILDLKSTYPEAWADLSALRRATKPGSRVRQLPLDIPLSRFLVPLVCELRTIVSAQDNLARLPWQTDGVELPHEAKVLYVSRSKERGGVVEGLLAAVGGLATENPKLAAVLKNGKCRRKCGELFAREGQRKLVKKTFARTLRVAEIYEAIRQRYPDDEQGQKQMRLELARQLSRQESKPRVCDKTIREHLARAKDYYAGKTPEKR